jgi:hypothetical protein
MITVSSHVRSLLDKKTNERPIPPVERVLEAEWKLNLPSELEQASYAKQGIRPGLLKRTSRIAGPSEGIERRSIAANARELRTFDLAMEHGQLLAEQGLLYHQFRLGAGEVKGNVQDRGSTR